MDQPPLRPVVWLGDSHESLKGFPDPVQDEMGYALFLAQTGRKHRNAKPLKYFGSGVLEIVSDHSGNTYRAVYLLRLAERIYVLHTFQKKSTRGLSTPRTHLNLIERRIKQALEHHAGLEK